MKDNTDWMYRKNLIGLIEKRNLNITELRSKDLACWCPLDKPCHADVRNLISKEIEKNDN